MGLISVRPTREYWATHMWSGGSASLDLTAPPTIPCPSPGAAVDTRTPQPAAHLDPVDQQSANFLTPGTSFVEGSFSTDQGMLRWGTAVNIGGASLMCPPLCGSVPHRPGPVLPCGLGSEDACGSLSILRASTCSAPPLPALLPYRDFSGLGAPVQERPQGVGGTCILGGTGVGGHQGSVG